MADQTQLTQWMVRNKDVLGLKIREFTWPQRLGLHAFDFEVRIQLRGTISAGRGTDAREEIALEKACAEAIERWVCDQRGISTVGVAVHLDEASALENSRLELHERFAFDWHLKTQTPFLCFCPERSLMVEVDEMERALRRLNSHAVVNFKEMKVVGRNSGVVCVISSGDQFISLGLSLQRCFSEAIRKAFFEAARNFVAFADDPVRFDARVSSDHNLWCSNSQFLERLRPLLESSVSERATTAPIVTLESEKMALVGLEECIGCPAVVMKSRIKETKT